MRPMRQMLIAIGIVLFIAYLTKNVREGFANVDDSLLHKNTITNGLPVGALCINDSQCLSKRCKSSLTGLRLTGQSTKLEDVPLAKYGNCVTE